jgi:cell division protein FtsW
MARLQAFIDPFSQAQAAGYQVVQSLIAFSNGGLLGTGVGSGRQKLFYLPEMHTDYIFSVIGEELGFLGVVVVGACYITMVWVGYRIARRARDPFGKYIAMGFSSVIGIQALMNMMVGLKMLPPKGMVLPFLSYGGSSLVLHLAAIGILMNVSLKGADGIVTADDHRRGRDRRARLSGDRAC